MNREKSLRRLDNFKGYIKSLLKTSVTVDYVSDKNRSMTVLNKNKPYSQVVVCSSILSDDCQIVREYDFVETVISIAHECHHAAVLQQSRALKDSIISLSESYVSRINNDVTYCKDYNKFTYEIAAERFALRESYGYLNKEFPMLDTGAIILIM